MSDLAKREENGNKGETRTQAFLLDSYWVMRRSVDVDGADFLVQEQANTLEELRERTKKLEVLGIIQAKFFEGRNEVAVLQDYVLDTTGTPRPEFFISIHTDDKEGRHEDYFFTAEQITKAFRPRVNADKTKVFVFSITEERKYTEFRNLSPKAKNELIREGTKRATADRNAELLQVALAVAKSYLESRQSRLTQTDSNEFRVRRGSLNYIFQREGLYTSGRVYDAMTDTFKTLPPPPPDMEKHEFDPVAEIWRVKMPGS